MGKQFRDVNCKYGAPMGRSGIGSIQDVQGKVSLFKVRLHQGYDDGGVYWGGGFGVDSLYCARSVPNSGDCFEDFTRAKSREDARERLGIPQSKLLLPTKPVSRKPIGRLLRRITFRPYGTRTRPFFTLCLYALDHDPVDRNLGFTLSMGPRKLFTERRFILPFSFDRPLDSNATVRSVMYYLCLREGDVTDSHFDNYTVAQLEFRDEHAEPLLQHVITLYSDSV